MKKLLITALTIYSSVLMIGCGKDGGGGGQVVPPPACPVGQVLNGNVCVHNSGITPGGNVQYYDYNKFFTQTGYGVSTVNGDMTITNSAAYKSFLREAMGVCDRTIVGWDIGLSSCDNWVSGSFQASFLVTSDLKPTVRFEARPAPSYFNGFGSLGISGGGAAFNPLILSQNNTFSLINNSQGFEIRAQGSNWNGGGLRLIQIQVLQGTLNDGYFSYDLYYPHNNVATKFASGKFKRY